MTAPHTRDSCQGLVGRHPHGGGRALRPASSHRCPRVVELLKALAQASEAGQLLVWVAAMLPFFLSVVGLSLDGAVVFGARRELQNLADGAARAAVTQVDVGLYERTGTVALHREAAVRTADDHLATRQPGVAWSIETESQAVVVEVGSEVSLTFLRLLGWRSVFLTARAPAQLRHGIEAAW